VHPSGVEGTVVHAMKAYGEVSGQPHTLAALPLKKELLVPMD
jgi:hypothetical protein